MNFKRKPDAFQEALFRRYLDRRASQSDIDGLADIIKEFIGIYDTLLALQETDAEFDKEKVDRLCERYVQLRDAFRAKVQHARKLGISLRGIEQYVPFDMSVLQ